MTRSVPRPHNWLHGWLGVIRMGKRGGFVVSTGAMRLASLVLLSLLMLGVALADEADPPGRVARLSYVQGAVSLSPAGEQDWVGAEINRPITTGDRLWSDTPGSRAELDIGNAVIRLGANTGLSFLNLDDNVAQMQVTDGTVIVHLRELLDNQTYEIDTPNIALVLDQPGEYRIDVDGSGNATVVRVAEGQAEASGGGQTMPVYNQQMVSFTGTDQLAASGGSLGAPDGFDDWSYERDREYEQAASRQYVPEDMAGTEDLDDNGQWENTPDYGHVWVPTAVAAGWAPYSVGHWAWVSPWGWTWVDNASWGFAPFHYGRWARWRNSWCWVPGPRHVRPIYSPAMVAWVGGGAGVAAGVGWFPLGPREVYVPGYRVSDRYVRSINITNTTIVDHTYITNVYERRITNVRYVNSGVPGAVTTVSRNVFTSAQPVNAHRVSLPPSQLARLSATAAPPAITPVRQSRLGGGAEGFGRRPPQVVLNRTVVARTAPPAATAAAARVRLIGPAQEAGGRGAVFGRPGQSIQQGRPGAVAGQQALPAQQQQRMPNQSRLPVQQRPAPAAAVNVPPADTRSWAERARALGQPSLPPSQAARERPPVVREEERPEGIQGAQEERASPGRTLRDDRPPSAYQSEQSRQPANTYRPPVERPQEFERPQVERSQPQRPQFENRVIEERRGQASPQAPVPRFQAPPPAPVPRFQSPAPPPAPVPTRPGAPPASQQHENRNEGRPAPPPSRADPRLR